MFNKNHAVILFVLVFALAASGIFTIFYDAVWLVTSSPQKRYKVELHGDKTKSSIPLIDHKVKFNLSVDDRLNLSDKTLITFDYFDAGFDKNYLKHEWKGESVLQFFTHASESEKRFDQIIVSNKTDRIIKYLKVNSYDLLLLFDIQPNSVTKLETTRQKWQVWVTAQGEFTGGELIPEKGMNFSPKDKFQIPMKYCISINNNGLTIDSPLLEGRNFDQPNTPKDLTCGE